jgi:RNA polymerase sigma-70 factor (ECF subfamily)
MEPLSRIVVPAQDIMAAARGERAAQARLYALLAPGVFRLVARLVPAHAAEDVFQDCMMNVLQHLRAYRGDASVGAWVRAIAINHALMHLRSPWHRLRDRALAGFEKAAEEANGTTVWRDTAAARVELDRLLDALEPRARAIVWLHDVEGFTHEEIAAAFGLSVSFSKSQLARAHRRLRALAAAQPMPPRACREART